MSNLDLNQPPNDKIQQQVGSDQGNNTSLVDMSNPAQLQNTFKSNTGDTNPSVVSAQCEMMFSNPYESANQNNWNPNNWNDSVWSNASGTSPSDCRSQVTDGDGNNWTGSNNGNVGASQDFSTGQSVTDSAAVTSSPLTDASVAGQNTAEAISTYQTLQMELQIAQLQVELAQVMAEFAKTNIGPTPSSSPTDSTATAGSTAPKAQSAGGPTASSTSTAAASAPESTISQPATTVSTPSDPLLAKTLTDASGQLSAAGYSQLDQYINSNYTNSANDSQLMSQALKQAGLSSADNAALTKVLQSDMPTALSTTSSNSATPSSDASTATAPATTSGDASTSTAPNPATPATATSDTATVTINANGRSESASTTPGAADTYHVSGNQIIGPNGKPFIMTGINDTSSTEHDELTGDFGTLAAEGANTVRLMGTAADLENPNDAFNQEVRSALSAGMFVDITDMSDESQYGNTGAIYSQADVAEAAQAMKTSSAMYANNANVGFDIANEQGASGDANNPTLLSNTKTLLAAVNSGAQSVNPNADPIKFVDNSTWGQGAFSSNLSSDSFLAQNAKALETYGNVVGAVHDYESSAGQYNTAGINAIQAQGMPVIAEEVGVQDPTIAADSFNTLSQKQSTTGEPIGGLVWIDGTQPGGSFYNNVMNTSEAPAIQNFWQTIDAQAATAQTTA